MATIITKNSSTASAVPAAGDLVKGELAVNVTDKKVYTKDNSAAIVKLVGSLGNQESNAVAITGGTINGTTIGATTPSTGAFTTASASSGFTGNLTGNVTGNVSGTASNVTGVVAIANGGTGLSSLGTGVQTALGQAVTGSGSFVLSTSPSLTTPNLGTPSAAVLTNATGLPLTTGVTGTLGVANGGTGITAFGTGVATALGQSVTGSGGIVLASSPSLTTPNLGTPSAATLTNATGLPISTGVSGLGTGVATALAVNTGSSGAFVVNGGALGTPSSGTLTNATGLPLSTGVTGTLAVANGGTGLTSFTANGVVYASSTSALTTGSALTFDGTILGVTTSSVSDATLLTLTGNSGVRQQFNPQNLAGTKYNWRIDVNGLADQTWSIVPSTVVGGSTFSTPVYQANGNGTQIWSVGSSEAMRLTSTGLGIGTSSPGSKLDVKGTLRLSGSTSGYVGLAPAAAAGSTTYTLPAADGTNGQALTTNGSGTLSWTTAGASAATPTARGTLYGYSDTQSTYGAAWVGYQAGASDTGSYNAGIGYRAGYSNTSGSYNVAVGTQALQANTTASENTAVGYQASFSGTTGTGNTSVGMYALQLTTTASYNTGLGWYALQSNTTGADNTAVGAGANYLNTTGSSNTAIGKQALRSNTTASYNTAVGYQAGYSNTTGSRLTAVGLGAMYTNSTGVDNTAVGANALYFNTTGSYNAAFGLGALQANTTASSNNAHGYQAAYNNTTGNIDAFGYQAGFSNTTGGSSQSNTAMGYRALYSNTTGQGNTALGGVGTSTNSAMYANTTGSYNTAVGNQALRSNTTASNNTAVGYQAGFSNTTAPSNTAVGYFAGASLTTGGYNTIMGDSAGNYTVAMTTAAQCVIIGYRAQPSGAGDGDSIVIGANATGKGTGTGFISPGGGGVYQGNNSSSWSQTSDVRLKKNIVDNNEGIDVISQIRVRNFEYRLPEEVTELPEHTAIKRPGVQLGVIAQELQQVCPDCVKEESTGVLSVDSDNVFWHMVNAIKQLKTELDTVKAELATLKGA